MALTEAESPDFALEQEEPSSLPSIQVANFFLENQPRLHAVETQSLHLSKRPLSCMDYFPMTHLLNPLLLLLLGKRLESVAESALCLPAGSKDALVQGCDGIHGKVW
jgi:hypothetical protein